MRLHLIPVLFLFPLMGRGGEHTLESQAVRLTVHDSPYRFKLIERADERVILEHRETQFHGHLSRSTFRPKKVSQENGVLTLSSNQKSVRFEWLTSEILKIDLRATDSSAITEKFVDLGEENYGLWEQVKTQGLSSLRNRGASARLSGASAFDDRDGTLSSSVRAPFYMTSLNYGIYVKSSSSAHYSIAKEGFTRFKFQGSELTYYIIYGENYAQILKRYNELAGPAWLPPDWALGPLWWRDDAFEDLRSSEGQQLANAQEVVLNDARELAKFKIPATALWIDRPYSTPVKGFGWGGLGPNGKLGFAPSFPNPAKMVGDLREMGLNLLLWIANRADLSTDLGREGRSKDYLFDHRWKLFGAGIFDDRRAVNVGNSEAYSWFQEKLAGYASLGIRGYKIDRGDESEIPKDLENQHAVLFPKLAAEGLAKVVGNDRLVFARNAYDTARKYISVWNGDAFGWRGFRESVRHAVRCGLINFPMWGSDVGGYGETTPDLFARWIEFAAYSPMMEIMIGPNRTPWLDFSKEIYDIVVAQVREKTELIPYVRSMLKQSQLTGMPVMRALLLNYPQDPRARSEADQYLFGSELLVMPMTYSEGNSILMYFPEGKWIDYRNKREVIQGPALQRVDAPLGQMPVFAREGAIIPRGDVVKGNNTWTPNWKPSLRIQFFPSRTTESSFPYWTGEMEKIIRSIGSGDSVMLEFGDLGPSGIIEVYGLTPAQVELNGQMLEAGKDYHYEAAQRFLKVPFQGAVRLKLSNLDS